MFGAVVVSLAVARYLGPARFGLLNYGLAIYSLFNMLSNLGLDFLVVREVALDQGAEHQILGTAFVLNGVGSVVTTIAAIVATWILEPHNTVLIEIVALISFSSVSQALDVIDFFFQAHTRSRYAVIPRNIAFICASVARLVAVLLHLDLLAFAWIAALEVLFAELGLGISFLLFSRCSPRWNWNLARAKSLVSESWPLVVSSVLVMIYMRSDQILLGKLVSKEVVGQYTAAIRLSEIWYAVPIIICASVMPRLLKTREQDPRRYFRLLQRLYDSMVLISVSLAVATQFAAPLAVRLLYGRQFASAAGILSVHIWTGLFVFVGCVGGQQFIQEGLTVSSMKRAALGAILNVLLNVLWIPRWGGMGSAMATLAAQSVASYFADAFDRRTRHIFRMKTRAYLCFWTLPRLIIHGIGE